jgi:hypothetical protein
MYGSETWSLTMKQERRLKGFENRDRDIWTSGTGIKRKLE